MDLKEVIQNFIKNNKEIKAIRADIFEDFENGGNADSAMVKLKDALVKYKYNLALGIDFTDNLQLLNDEKLVEQYEENDLQKLFQSMIDIQEFNLEVYAEAAHFEWVMMDNDSKAKELIKLGIEKAKSKIEELEKLLIDIDE